jgi:autotransporter-associated beta strand protein
MGRNVLVRSGNTGTMTVGGVNTSGTAEYQAAVLLGTANSTSKGVSLYAEDGGTVDFSGGILVNGKAGAGYDVTKTGLGTVILSGSDNYTGATTVAQGTLIATSVGAFADGSSLTVGDASAFAPAPPVPAAVAQSAPAAVPEPGTAGLLVAAIGSAAGILRRRNAARTLAQRATLAQRTTSAK